jgi:hypothetical protein
VTRHLGEIRDQCSQKGVTHKAKANSRTS